MALFFRKKKSTCYESKEINNISNDQFKMNKIINNFLLTGNKFMLELHLKQPEFPYSPCGPFTKHGKRIQNFKEIRNLKHLYINELDKPCFLMMLHILIVKIQLKELFR